MVFLSIVIPAFNEQDRLPHTLQRIRAYLDAGEPRGRGGDTEIIVVDDGSTDCTAQAAREFGAARADVRVLENPGNRGKGYAVRHGMLAATGTWVLFTDADLSAPIEELAALLAAVETRQAQVVIGSRAMDRSLIGVHQSWFRENAGRLFNLLMRLIVGLPFWDTQCGFKLFRQDVAKAVFSRTQLDGFGFDAESLFIAHKLGYKIVEVPVRWSHVEGTKLSLMGDSAKMFVDLLRVRWNSIRGVYSRPPGQVSGAAE